LGIGDWGLGIGVWGVWAKTPNPRTQTQNHKPQKLKINFLNKKKKI